MEKDIRNMTDEEIQNLDMDEFVGLSIGHYIKDIKKTNVTITLLMIVEVLVILSALFIKVDSSLVVMHTTIIIVNAILLYNNIIHLKYAHIGFDAHVALFESTGVTDELTEDIIGQAKDEIKKAPIKWDFLYKL